MSEQTLIDEPVEGREPQRRGRGLAVLAVALLAGLMAAQVAVLLNIADRLETIEANTAPTEFLRGFCTDPQQLNDLYDEMVYQGPDNIHQQAHRQREFRAQVLTYCNR